MRTSIARARLFLVLSVGTVVVLASCVGRRPSPTIEPTEVQQDSVIVIDTMVRTTDSLLTDSVIVQDSARTDSVPPVEVEPDSQAVADSIVESPPKDSTPARQTSKECILDFSESPPESRLLTSLLPDGSRNTFIGGGLVARCQGEAQSIRADSAEQYENAGMLVLIGNVVFDEPGKIRVTAPTASYFTGEEKLVAYGGVVATDISTGSTFTGPTMEYFRAGSRRPFARLYAPQRPTLRLVELDSLGRERPPVSITANQFEAFGDTALVGWGNVQLDREQITGQSDSMSVDQITERVRLIRNAFVASRDTTREFRLSGDSIDMFSNDRVLERVLAIHTAQATSNEVSMRAERVEMKLDGQKVTSAWAYGAGRSYAVTEAQELEADSIEILMPDQLVKSLHAVGQASAFGTPDTTRIKDPEKDVLKGDTIIAEFDTVTTPPDTTVRNQIKLITAIQQASAQYQVASSVGPHCPPSINYVRGRKIILSFDSGAVKEVTVDSQASGIFLEPFPDSLDPNSSFRCEPLLQPVLDTIDSIAIPDSSLRISIYHSIKDIEWQDSIQRSDAPSRRSELPGLLTRNHLMKPESWFKDYD